MKPYLVVALQDSTIEFAESPDEIRSNLLQKGEQKKELLIKEIALPQGWELRRVSEKESTRRFISIEPAMHSGDPTAGRSGVSAELVAKRWWTGESPLEDLEEDWPGLDRGQVLVCCWYAVKYGPRRWKKRWGEWAESVFGKLWHSDWEGATMPPTAKS